MATAIERSGAPLNIPALCDAELVSALRGLIRRRTITRDRGRLALDHYGDLPLVRHAHQAVLVRAFELQGFSAYDAIYVALAERLGAPVLTTDRRLARALVGIRGVDVTLA